VRGETAPPPGEGMWGRLTSHVLRLTSHVSRPSFRALQNNDVAYATATTATTMYAATMYPALSGVTPHLLVSQFLKVGHRVSLYNEAHVQQHKDADR